MTEVLLKPMAAAFMVMLIPVALWATGCYFYNKGRVEAPPTSGPKFLALHNCHMTEYKYTGYRQTGKSSWRQYDAQFVCDFGTHREVVYGFLPE